MRAVVLAAGRGTRLGPLGAQGPKCLLLINGVPLLEFLCTSLWRTGCVKEVVVVGGYRIEELRARLPRDVVLVENAAYAETNSLYSLWLALQGIEDGDLAVFNGDVVYQPSLLDRFLNHPRPTASLVDELRPYDANEYQAQVVDGLIRRIGRGLAPQDSSGQDGQAFKISRDDYPLFRSGVSALIADGHRNSFAIHALEGVMERSSLHPVFTNSESWCEFDSDGEYLACQERFATPEVREWFSEAYGTGGASDAPDDLSVDQDHPPRPFTSAGRILRRGMQCIWNRELPWRLQWIPEFSRVMRRSPPTALRHFRALASARLSMRGFRLQAYGLEMLRMVMEEAARLEMKPFLMWGTLLGYVREKGFILNDDDLDMGLLETDFQRAGELKARLLARGFRLRIEDEYKLSMFHPTAEHLWVDFDLIHEAAGHMWSTNALQKDFLYSYYFPRSSFRNLREASFGDVRIFLPGEPMEVLEYIYGNWRVRQRKRGFLRGPLNLRLRAKRPRESVEDD